jgi:hypothetical protein
LAVVEIPMGLYHSAELRRPISFGAEDVTEYIPPLAPGGSLM